MRELIMKFCKEFEMHNRRVKYIILPDGMYSRLVSELGNNIKSLNGVDIYFMSANRIEFGFLGGGE
jgi:hypothetical protein